ncbi:hypothetical protein [Aureivirga sp. CE67]|uniref:hypothetical protein n=1 Tax=Aureivirga sp. CE67 TaxID=1788983 RepID=UPI0018CA13C4|nr:hypothetical protein [Aureivirga sp. CE67]
MTLIFIAIALAGIFLWLNYFKSIDVFEKESIVTIIISILIGASLVGFVYIYDAFLYVKIDEYNDFKTFLESFINDNLLKTGLLFVAFYLFQKFFKKEINEPIDQILYACMMAAGFFGAEFILYSNHFTLAEVLNIDSIFTIDLFVTICSTAIFAYGFVLKDYKKNKFSVPEFLIYSILFNACFTLVRILDDYFELPRLIAVFSLVFFLFSVSILKHIINNSLNQSPYFSIKKIINSSLVRNQLLIMFGVIFLLQFILIVSFADTGHAVSHILFMVFSTGYIAGIASVSLCHMKLVKGKWYAFKIQLPFYPRGYGGKLAIRGFSGDENDFLPFYEENFNLFNVNQNISTAQKNEDYVRINRKLFFEGDELGFLATIYKDEKETKVILYPKLQGVTKIDEKHPVVGVYSLNKSIDLKEEELDIEDFVLMYWQKMVLLEVKEELILN